MFYDQLVIVIENQTYIDDYKKSIGRPLPFMQSADENFGADRLFWLLPTQPMLHINYLEKLYKLDNIRTGDVDLEVDEYDSTGKEKKKTKQEVRLDRMLFANLCLVALGACALGVYYGTF